MIAAVWALGACIPGSLSLAPGGADAAASGADAAASSEDGGLDALGPVPDSTAATSSNGDTGATGAGDDGASGDSGSSCTCVPAAPPGWTLIAFDGTSRPSCPGGYGSPTDVLVDPTGLGPSTCACACTVTTDPTCTNGNLGLIGGNNSSCSNTGNPVPAKSTCTTEPVNLPFPFLGVQPPAASGGSCTPNVTATPPTPGGTSGLTCSPSSLPSQGTCGSSDVCAPNVPSPYALCIAQAGAASCPAAYPHAHTTGTSITPGGCGTCTCGSPSASCTTGTFSAYTDTSCNSLLLSIAADGLCHATSSGTAESYKFTVTPTSLACAPSQAPQPTGNATLQGTMTVCCP